MAEAAATALVVFYKHTENHTTPALPCSESGGAGGRGRGGICGQCHWSPSLPLRHCDCNLKQFRSCGSPARARAGDAGSGFTPGIL